MALLTFHTHYQARALRALGLLLADGAPTVGGGEDFLTGQLNFFTETAVTPERKVKKWFPRWEIPPSFVEIGLKLRVGTPLTWEWPKRAKNRG